MDNLDILKAQLEAEQAHRGYAVVTITASGGSTPRSSGKLLVFDDGAALGTIGGGAVEQAAIRDAMECLRNGENRSFHYDLATENAGLGMVCGGDITVFVESHRARPLLVMCGAGHVGGAVAHVAGFLGFDVIMLDNRPIDAVRERARLAGRFIQAEDIAKGLAELDLPGGAYIVIATYGHSQDGGALHAALTKRAAYIGMIGSRAKVRTLFDRLIAQGISEEQLSAVHAPIGLDLGGETPEEIAVSIMSEILSVRYNAPCTHMRDKLK